MKLLLITLIVLFANCNNPCVIVEKYIEVEFVGDNYSINTDEDYWVIINGQRALKRQEVEYKNNKLSRLKIYKAELIEVYTESDLNKDQALIKYYKVQLSPKCFFLNAEKYPNEIVRIDKKNRLIIENVQYDNLNEKKIVYYY